jgi:tetratricopeptide (TPR) repeat protein
LDDLRRQGKTEPFVEACTDLISRFPDEFEPYFRRAQGKRAAGDRMEAIADISSAIERQVEEPALYFFRGLWRVEEGMFDIGTEDLREAARRDHVQGSSYYSEAAHFTSAIAHLLQGQFAEAATELSQVPRETSAYVRGRLWTSENLRECIRSREVPRA